jgi:hypothetical protein
LELELWDKYPLKYSGHLTMKDREEREAVREKKTVII